MFVIKIHFLRNGYHATPWGKHVNEGIPEWPPSPWRIIRAIIATWKNTHSELPEKDVWPILQKLINELPDYMIPDASISHTRHYMPTNNNKTTLIIDTFVSIGDKPVNIIWKNTTLDIEEIKILDQILKNLHYLGRAESWCKATISTEQHSYNCSPLGDEELPLDVEITSILAPKQNVKFTDISKPTTKPDLDTISITTKELQYNNHIDPPGGVWVQYVRPQNCFEEKLVHDTKTSYLNNINLVRYAIGGAVRPSITDTLRMGDLARTACMSKYGKIKHGHTSATFSGKDGNGKPLINHKHAFYLPTYETQNRELDQLTIISSEGFDKDELDALFSLKRLYKYNVAAVNLIFQGCGTIENFPDISILKKSRIWVSSTPLILSRHIKYRGKGSEKYMVDGPEEQIRNEIKNRYGDSYQLKSITIEDDKTNMHNTNIKSFEFFRWRRHGSVGDGKSYKVQLEFTNTVSGPITLGYSSHYGLGMFVPIGG